MISTPVTWRLAAFNAATAAARTVPASLVDAFASVEIGPGSQLDACYVQPANASRPMLINVGSPLLPGEWKGPIAITPYRTATAPTGAGYDPLLELAFAPREIPSGRKRAHDYSERKTITVDNTEEIICEIPLFGRKRISLIFSQTGVGTDNSALAWRLLAANYSSALEAQLYPLPSGTESLAEDGTKALTIEAELFDSLQLLAATADAGETCTVTLAWEAED